MNGLKLVYTRSDNHHQTYNSPHLAQVTMSSFQHVVDALKELMNKCNTHMGPCTEEEELCKMSIYTTCVFDDFPQLVSEHVGNSFGATSSDSLRHLSAALLAIRAQHAPTEVGQSPVTTTVTPARKREEEDSETQVGVYDKRQKLSAKAARWFDGTHQKPRQ